MNKNLKVLKNNKFQKNLKKNWVNQIHKYKMNNNKMRREKNNFKMF
jgi:hypothetical protein